MALIAIFPLHEPVLIFTVLIGTILIFPFIFRLFKMPDVASFIIAGVLVGPHGFNILARDASIELLGTAGLLYIMFIAGLELDPEKLKSSRKNSLVFGIMTFCLPFILGMLVCRHLLGLDFNASLLISIMFSTHTLVAFPLVRKLGVSGDMAVLMAVGGTIITDTLVLMILSIVTQSFEGGSILLQVGRILLFFIAYLVAVLYTFPLIARWFFKHVKRDRPVHYLFLLFMVSVSSVLAELIGVEAIIGAFVAGIALNRSIPKNSLLMHHVDLVGNIIFIPVFLLGIGMLIDTKILIAGWDLWFVSAILIVTAFAGKWLAAYFSQLALGFKALQRNLLFSLTSAHAAATIAVILIGYERQMIDITVFNATVLIILFSSLISTILTERFGKKLALTIVHQQETSNEPGILVPIANPSNMSNLVAIAHGFQSDNPDDPVFVLKIINDDVNAKENLVKLREIMEHNVSEYNHLSENLKVITRVDLSVSSGIIRAAKEYMVSDIVIGWGEKPSASQRIFGSIFDHLMNSPHTLFACNINGPIEKIGKVSVYVPENMEHESVFASILNKISRLPLRPDGQITFAANSVPQLEQIKQALPKKTKNGTSCILESKILPILAADHIDVIFLIRKQFISYNSKYNNDIHKLLPTLHQHNFILVVPGFDE
jgi:Kef-type K+ transport system membrane component KefB